MNRSTILAPLIPLFGVLAVAGPPVQHYPSCRQDHPKRARRLESLTKAGDAKMAHKAAGHAVIYAVHRYTLESYFDEQDIKAAADDMYAFLKWKLGSPALVAAQWLTGGYQHFDKTYVDEAAAMLLGVLDLELSEPEIQLPPWVLTYLEGRIEKGSETVESFLSVQWGLPDVVASALAKKALEELTKLVDRNAVGVYIPKSFDVQDRLVEEAVRILRGQVKMGEFRKGPWSADRPSGSSLPTDRGLEGRLAEMEARIARLEGRFGSLLGPGGLQGGAPVSRGYESLYLKVGTNAYSTEVRLSVNGLLAGVYQRTTDLDLTPFLEPGKFNEVSIELVPLEGKKVWVQLSLSGGLPGGATAITLFDFQSEGERLQDRVSIPIAER